jgi:hypothetical protein
VDRCESVDLNTRRRGRLQAVTDCRGCIAYAVPSASACVSAVSGHGCRLTGLLVKPTVSWDVIPYTTLKMEATSCCEMSANTN